MDPDAADSTSASTLLYARERPDAAVLWRRAATSTETSGTGFERTQDRRGN